MSKTYDRFVFEHDTIKGLSDIDRKSICKADMGEIKQMILVLKNEIEDLKGD